MAAGYHGEGDKLVVCEYQGDWSLKPERRMCTACGRIIQQVWLCSRECGLRYCGEHAIPWGALGLTAAAAAMPRT